MRGTATRRKHTKSRAGCLACKRRHVRCDESKPKCANCIKHNVACVYQPPNTGPRSATQTIPLTFTYPNLCPEDISSEASKQKHDGDPSPYVMESKPPFHAPRDTLMPSYASIASLDPYSESLVPMTVERRDKLNFCRWIIFNSKIRYYRGFRSPWIGFYSKFWGGNMRDLGSGSDHT